MKFFRLDLLTLLISLFILNGCKNQDTTGFTLGTKGSLSGTIVDTTTIYTKTVSDDSVVTSGIVKTPLGYINDPVFGATQSDIVTDLNLPLSTAYTLPAGTITIDSAVLLLKYAKGSFYGDSSLASKYVINVYQLSQRQGANSTYYSNSVFSHQSTLLGSTSQLKYNFVPKPNTNLVIDSNVTGKPPVPDTVSAQIRIPISQDFIRTNLFGASAATLGSNLIFKNNVKGLYITVDKTQSTGVGGMMMIKGDSIAMNIYIRAVSGSVIDTALVTLPVTQYATSITQTRSPVLQSALANKTNPTDSIVYLQGLAGTRVKVSFPFIDSLFSHQNVGGINNVIINRAELVVSVNPGSDIPAYLTPLPRLTMYMLDIAHRPIEIPDAASVTTDGVSAFGGFLYTNVKPANSYHFLITSYVQNIITNKLVDYGTYLSAADTSAASSTTIPVGGTPEIANRVIVGGGYSNNPTKTPGAGNSPYSMRLNVIYTKIK